MKRNLFNSVKMTKPNRNVFDLTHDVKLSCFMGDLIPIMALDTVPGDKFNISCESLLRFAPLVSPVMHRFDVTMHYFFVPNRILWPNWENFITNTKVAGVLPAVPTFQYDDTTSDYKLLDYFGLPKPPVGANPEVASALPLAAYQRIVNEYYRDQNLMPDLEFQLNDGDNTANLQLRQLRTRCWEHDYFTSALPFAQKGDSVQLPIADFNNVLVKRNTNTGVNATIEATPNDLLAQPLDDNQYAYDQLIAETSELAAGSASINDLRRAFRLQEWLEKAARGGSRYVENILSFFGVRSQDSRLQRPEYITGTKSPVVISEVLNTTGTEELPQGNMAGHGASVTQGGYGSYFCHEHGYIIGIMSVMPKTAYQQGIERHWSRTSPFDYFWPQFANIGEQEIKNKEVYAFQGATGEQTFGYIPRYAEYKYMNNRVAGQFREQLNFWHAGRIFDTPPALNEAFVQADPTQRIFAVTDTTVEKLYVHVLNKIKAIRPMPKYGTPTF